MCTVACKVTDEGGTSKGENFLDKKTESKKDVKVTRGDGAMWRRVG